MTISELKLRLNTSLNGLIDTYFGNANVTERMINATLKVLVKQNINKADKAMMLFADENGEICPKEILQMYAEQIGDDGITLDISERTVKNHVSNIFKKIEVTDRTQAAVFAIRNNLVEVY